MMDDILTCPFCGGVPEIDGTGRVFIRCSRCGSKGKAYRFRWFDKDSYFAAEDRAVRAWNRRLGCYGTEG